MHTNNFERCKYQTLVVIHCNSVLPLISACQGVLRHWNGHVYQSKHRQIPNSISWCNKPHIQGQRGQFARKLYRNGSDSGTTGGENKSKIISPKLYPFHQFIVVAHRCTMNMKTCEPFNTIALSRICTYINDENGMLASFFRTMEPNLRCPIRPGLYRFVNSTMNLKFFTAFPIEGYRWQASLKLYSKEKGIKRELYCLSGHASMKWVRKA